MPIIYQAGSVKAEGELYLPRGKGPFPTIILFPAFRGPDEMAKHFADDIVSSYGWAVFLADYYGSGKVASSEQEAGSLMTPLFTNREELRKRASAAYEAVKGQENVDPSKIGAIGFCFGGLAAIELFKMGLPLLGIVPFHAVLGYKMGDKTAKALPIAKEIKTALLVLNGYLDPLIPQDDRLNFEKEMKEAGVDWQYHLFGQAGHAFTNPESHDPSKGRIFDPKIANRAFRLMGDFFSELFLGFNR